MRTIIINTLGNQLRHDSLFYLPFDDNQLLWIEKSLSRLSECGEEIAAFQADQVKSQSYRLVVMANLACLKDAQYSRISTLYEKILAAYINEQLLLPLCQTRHLPPVDATLVFVRKELCDGEGNMATGKEYDAIFGFLDQQTPVESLKILPVDGSEPLVMDAMFSTVLEDYRDALQFQEKAIVTYDPAHALELMRNGITERIDSLQQCLYHQLGYSEPLLLKVERLEFFPKSTDPSMVSLNLQIDLSEHLAQQCCSSTPIPLQLPTYDEQTLRNRVVQARKRVQHLRKQAPRETYYPLQNQPRGSNAGSLSGAIWTELMEKKSSVEGVQEAHDHAVKGEEPKSPVGKLRHRWILLKKEKKQFDGLCRMLEEWYHPDAAMSQQAAIFDTCAGVFNTWRKKALALEPSLPNAPTETEMPIFDGVKAKEELEQAQQLFSQSAAEKLEDYEDVRQEAEEVKAKFRKAWRFWHFDSSAATKFFWIYSGVLAVLFILQMLLPYLGITMGQDGVELSRFVHFGLSLAMFTGLYLVGLILWLMALCHELYQYSQEMKELLEQASERRRESIEAAVDMYGRILPDCTIRYEDMKELQYIHRTNLQRKDRYHTHLEILEQAETALKTLYTQLRIAESTAPPEVYSAARGLDYQKAPSHPDNVLYYVLLAEKWGDSL